MTLFASLNRIYGRMAARSDVAVPGYSAQKVAFAIRLDSNGEVLGDPVPFLRIDGKRQGVPLRNVPQPVKRTSSIAANFLWDKTSYVLGVTAGEGRRAAQEHAAFRTLHIDTLTGTEDEGLKALLRFLDHWTPEQFVAMGWPEEMRDQNVVFTLESDRLDNIFLHDREAARLLWARLIAEGKATQAACLVTGETGPIARLHPSIKGVWGAQSSGASLVSFNASAFESYGHEQGDNAPVSQMAAEAYTAVLNKFLERDSHHRLQVGDASTVFWAEAPDPAVAKKAEETFEGCFGDEPPDDGPINEAVEAKQVRATIDGLRKGQALNDPQLSAGVRFFVLGLAPNAARLSVRFYVEDDFGQIAERYRRFADAMRIEPPPKDPHPPVWRMLLETAAQRKSENVPPNLAGEWLRAVLTGARYPLALRSTILMRLRVDHDVNGLRVAMLRAVETSHGRKVPMSLDPANPDPGYLLGRLFATYEYAQTQALGAGVNATIRDQYYGTASATPRAVFPLLQRKVTHHLSRLRKERPGIAVVLDRKIGEIFELADADKLFVPILTASRQALFAVGYYHQRNDFYRRKDDASDKPNPEAKS